MYRNRKFWMGRLLLSVVLSVSGCRTDEHLTLHDHGKSLSQEQFVEQLTTPTKAPPTTPVAALKPKRTPEAIPPALKRKVSLSTTEAVPLKDLFFQIAQQAKVDVVIDPKIQGGVMFQAHERPFIDVVREICRMMRLRYKVERGILRIEPDHPYLKNYNVQFLSSKRESQNRTSIATDVFSTVEGRQQSLDNGSNTLLTEDSSTDFWSEIDQTLGTILLHSHSDADSEADQSYSIHKQAGLISVYASHVQHEQVAKYLQLLRESTNCQVLIEAKIVEVMLKDEFKSGINWNSLKGDFLIQSPLGSLVTPGPLNRTTLPKRDIVTIGGAGHHLTGLLSLMEKFGTVRTLSSPRMTVMNNQSAVLKVATNRVFFRIDYHRDYGFDNERERENVSSEIQTVPIGLVMVVHPSINLEDGNIVMTLRPTISRVVDEKQDPAVSILSKQSQESLIPQVQVRELDSVVSMQSGEIVVMGGLMEERSDNEQSGVPELQKITGPLGALFKSKSDDRTVTELVIFLKASIVKGMDPADSVARDSSVDAADQNLYETFTEDPRPLTF